MQVQLLSTSISKTVGQDYFQITKSDKKFYFKLCFLSPEFFAASWDNECARVNKRDLALLTPPLIKSLMAALYQRSTGKLGHSQYPIFHPTHRVEHLIREKTICFVGSFISGHKCVLVMARSLWPTLSLTYKHNCYPLSSQCCVNSSQPHPRF